MRHRWQAKREAPSQADDWLMTYADMITLLFMLFVLRNAIPVYGTLWILLFVFVIARLSYATRMTNSTLCPAIRWNRPRRTR